MSLEPSSASSFSAERLASVMRFWRSRPMTPADTPESTASMKRRRSMSCALAVTRSVRWRSSSLVMALKFIDSRRRSPSPRRIGSSTLRLPRVTCWAALIRRRMGATNCPANHSPIQMAASRDVSEIMKYMSPWANFRPPRTCRRLS